MTNFQLKLLALFLMILDHIGYFFPNQYTIFLRFIGRLSMPIFAFILVQGYINTKNIRNYIFRLFIFGGIMGYLNAIISITLNIDSNIKLSPLTPNIFITLSLSLLILYCIERAREDKGFYIIMFILIITSLIVEYSILTLVIVCFFFKFRENKKKMIISYILISLTLPLIISSWIQCFMVFAIIPISFYNNKLGFKNIYSQCFFYIFYPLHIYLLYLIQ